MKKIISVILFISFFCACTKEKKIAAQQQSNSINNDNAVPNGTANKLTDTSNKQNAIFLKKKAVKIKYPKPKKQH